jgi:hypothetical protein
MTALPPDEPFHLPILDNPHQLQAPTNERSQDLLRSDGFAVKDTETYTSADAAGLSRRGGCMVALPMEGGLSQHEG